MGERYWLVCLVVPPHLWIADQVRNDVTPFPALWFPAYAGMTVGMWMLGQVRIDGERVVSSSYLVAR